MNKIILVAVTAMLVAQIIKVPIWYFKYGEWRPDIMFSTGGMPSSHTAFILAATGQIGIDVGFDSVAFGAMFVVSCIVIHDAVKVRGESGKQAMQINNVKAQLESLGELLNIDESEYDENEKLKELIGHTYTEVLGGILIAIIVLFIYNI